jgi:hypothetical protein
MEEPKMSRTDLERERGLWTQAMLSSRVAAALDRKAGGVAPEEDDPILMSKASDVLRTVAEGTQGLLSESAAAPSGDVVFIIPSAFRLVLSMVQGLGKLQPKPQDLIDYLQSVSEAVQSQQATPEVYRLAESFFGRLSSVLSSNLSPPASTPAL